MLDRPAAAVDARKQNRLILAAQQYLQHSPYRDVAIRFDVVEVTPRRPRLAGALHPGRV